MATKKATKKKVTIQRSSEEWQRYAAAALGALVVDADSDWTDEGPDDTVEAVAELAARYADALVAEGKLRR